MAEKRISELTAKGSNLQSTDLIEVSVDAGGGLYNTRYITGAQITGAVSSANFANTNLTLTSSRTHDGDGYSITFDDVLAFRINSKVGINSAPNAGARFYVSAGTGLYAGYFDASDEIGVYAVSSSNRAVYALSSTFTAVEGISTTGRGGHFKSSGTYSLWSQSMDATNKQSILSNGLCDFKNYADTITILQLKDSGRVNMPSLPTSSVGLAAGDLWNDSGTIKIA